MKSSQSTTSIFPPIFSCQEKTVKGEKNFTLPLLTFVITVDGRVMNIINGISSVNELQAFVESGVWQMLPAMPQMIWDRLLELTDGKDVRFGTVKFLQHLMDKPKDTTNYNPGAEYANLLQYIRNCAPQQLAEKREAVWKRPIKKFDTSYRLAAGYAETQGDCPVCHRTVKQMRSHLLAHGRVNFVCHVCTESFTHECDARKHIRKKHEGCKIDSYITMY